MTQLWALRPAKDSWVTPVSSYLAVSVDDLPISSFSSESQKNLGKHNSCEYLLIRMYCILTKMYELDWLAMLPVFISYHSISISFTNWKGIEKTVSLCIYWYWVLFPSSWLTLSLSCQFEVPSPLPRFSPWLSWLSLLQRNPWETLYYSKPPPLPRDRV